jgi:hypothetical protein
MAHFAQINENNIVTQVIVVADADCAGGQFPESDPVGAAFCHKLLGGTWKQTSYNSNFRKHYAGIGYTYDHERGAFIPPQPFESWVLNEDTCLWDSPVPYPNDDKLYEWNENTHTWDSVEVD